MASLIQRTIPLLDSMSNQELQCIEQLARVRIKPTSSSQSELLRIPRELRDKIYYLVGVDHLRHLQDSPLECYRRGDPFHPLLLVNKQTRQEFNEFFYSRHMIRAVYLDDTVKNRDRDRWRRVPTWLLHELFRSRSLIDDCQLDWQQPYSTSEMIVEFDEALGIFTIDVKRMVKSNLEEDRMEDPDIPRSHDWIKRRVPPNDGEELEQHRLAVKNAEASRFHGYLETVGQEHMSPPFALLSFEKFLLSEDRWFKVDGFEEVDGVFARSARHRKKSVTVEQRLEAAKKQSRPIKRAKTVDFPLEEADATARSEELVLNQAKIVPFPER